MVHQDTHTQSGSDQPGPVNHFGHANLASESNVAKKVEALHKIIKSLDPNAGDGTPERVLKDLHAATGGEDFGFELYDWWLGQSKDYPGQSVTELQWAQLTAEQQPNCVGEVQAEQSTEPVSNTEALVPCAAATEQVALPATQSKRKANVLDRFSMSGMAHALEQQLVLAVAILAQLALMGQFTVLFAPPNTGKTLVVFALLIDAINRGLIDPGLLYVVNLDDTLQGVTEKLRLAEEYGFAMLSAGYKDFTVKRFLTAIEEMVAQGDCRGVVIVLDTLKKFVDVMDKKQLSRFNHLMRRFVLMGGTVIALAHTNKHAGANGKPVFAGVSDTLDDCDCAYMFSSVDAPIGSSDRFIEAINIKSRGAVAQSVAFTYSAEKDLGYLELLSSVRVVDREQLGVVKQAAAVASDAELIAMALGLIDAGVNTKMRLRDGIVQRAGVSNRAALQLLEKYTGTDPVAHRWTFSVGERGAKIYEVLAAPVVASRSKDVGA